MCSRRAAAIGLIILRSIVFHSDAAAWIAFAKHVALFALSGAVSHGLIGLLCGLPQMPVLWAKLAAEGFLFLGNFAIQREFVFTKRLG